ncbi:MAG: CBS domain-containing protein [Actinomycetota bacterium]
MRVAEIMTQASLTDAPGHSLRAAAETMWRQQTGSLVVIEAGRLVGIVTERDVLRAVATGRNVDSTTVGDVMTRDVVTTTGDASVRDAARVMAQHWIRHLPVVDGDRVVGILSQRDIAGIFAALWNEPAGSGIDTDDLVRSRRLARIEQGDLD